MFLAALLCLLTLPLQQNSKPETVALVFGPKPEQIQVIKTATAERLYAKLKPKHDAKRLTKAEAKTFAALTQSLGIQVPHIRDTRERLDWEIRRGVRPPLQPAEPKEVIPK